MRSNTIVGALVGWKREPSQNGMIISLQVLDPQTKVEDKQFQRVSLALNDRQLRSLARDLQRAADERGLTLWGGSKLRSRYLKSFFR
jgi:hypothetical protein